MEILDLKGLNREERILACEAYAKQYVRYLHRKDTEDEYQEAMLAAVQSVDECKAFPHMAATVAMAKMGNAVRRSWYAKRKHETRKEVLFEDSTADEDSLDALRLVDTEKVHLALNKLRGSDRYIVQYIFFEGMTQKQAAEKMLMSTGGIAHRLKRIFKELRKALTEDDGSQSAE